MQNFSLLVKPFSFFKWSVCAWTCRECLHLFEKNSCGKVHNINNDHTCGFSVMPGQSYGEVVSWMDSTEEEVTVWMSMIENPNHWIDATLPIRTNLTRRSEWLRRILHSSGIIRMHVAIMVGLKGSHLHIFIFTSLSQWCTLKHTGVFHMSILYTVHGTETHREV